MDYPELHNARERVARFLNDLPQGRVAILADGDVDGLGAAVCVAHRLEGRDVEFVTVAKGGNAFTPTAAERVRAKSPAALFVLDLGVRDFEIAPGVPTLILDHHRPLGAPKGAEVVSGYDWSPPPTSSLLTWLLLGDESTAWKAAIGNLGDLGPEFEPFAAAMKAQKMKFTREATSLLNAAKRSSDPEAAIPAAYRLLRDASSAKAVVESDSDDAVLLRGFYEEVKRELAEARRVGPKFSKTEPIALVRFDSPARVHPLIAQSWKGRLPKYVVMAANGGYLPGRVSFSMRTNADVNILDLLARHGKALGIDEPEYGLGHDRASGGSLKEADFDRLLASMGFP